ncbi:MAG: C10 family peptidase [Bacteroidales bacterium]|nr:C10 family peptidase [Bacteroidales bacterium]
MKRTSLVAAFLLLLSSVTMAKPVSLSDATRVATHFWQATNAAAPLQVSPIYLPGFTTLYAFDINQGKGFVIVPSDDVAFPILGYSNNSTAADLGPETRFWMNQYEAEISALINGSVNVDTAIAQYVADQWEKLRSGTWTEPKSGNAVPQLMTTTWNQSPIYNNFCPQGTPVGCTATATVQVMKYWNHPAQGSGSYSYYNYSTNTTESADFANTTYRWDIMPNSVSVSTPTDQADAVALISYHVGVGCEMSYAQGGSGASVIGRYYRSAEYTLIENFDYANDMQGLEKRYYTDQQWDQIIRDELDARRPIVYAGYDNSAGHAFVFDGYNNMGLFHVNWGWGGSYDGYYAVGVLNPGGGGVGTNSTNSFNESNQMLIGIRPNSTLYAEPSLVKMYQPGGSSTIQLTTNAYSTSSWSASSNASWLTVSPSSGSGATANITIAASAHNGDSARAATITIAQGTDTILIPVSQFTCAEADLCPLTVNMYDRRADGWEHAYLSFTTENGVSYGTATVNNGASAVVTIPVCNEPVVVTFHPGYADNDCGFFIHNQNGQMWVEHSNGTYFDSYTYLIANPCAATGGDSVPLYTIITQVNDTTMGTVMGGGENLTYGTECMLYAQATPGHRFNRWSDGVRANPRAVTAMTNRTYTAQFNNLGSDTMQYDNDAYTGFKGGNSDFEWAIRLRPEDLVGRRQINGVKFYARKSGSYTITVYQGDEAPENNIGRMIKSVNSRQVRQWMSFNFANPVTFDYSKPVWVAIKASNVEYPAATSNWCGNNDGAWVYDNGEWQILNDADAPEYTTFMIRPILPIDPTEYTLTVMRNRNSWGTVTGGGMYRYGQQVEITATPSEGYHFERWSNHSTDNPCIITVVSDTNIRAIFAEGEPEGIQQIESEGITLQIQNRQLTISGVNNRSLGIFDIMGRTIISTKRFNDAPIQLPYAGIFILRIDERLTLKVVAY